MKLRIFLTAAAIGLLVGARIVYTNAQRTKQIEAANQVESIQSERGRAKQLLIAQCTNSVPGIQNVVDVFVDDSVDRVSAWKGHATFDYRTSAGGIDRTNLLFTFGTPYGDMLCTLDAEWIARTERERLEQSFKAAAKQ